MQTKVMMVTPAMADAWLQKNTENRKVRPGAVEGFVKLWSNGEWKLTHQGIAFGTTGRLLDGQHRLLFIATLPEGTQVPINVTTGQDEDTFDAIDTGIRRTMADVYDIRLDLIAAARFTAKIYNATNIGLTNHFVKRFVDWIEPEFTMLKDFCGANAKLWSTAPVHCAAIVQMKRDYDSQFICETYRALVTGDFDNMASAAKAIVHQQLNGKIRYEQTHDVFVRSLRVFNSSEASTKIAKIIVRDQKATVDEIRKWMHVALDNFETSASRRKR